MKMVLDSSCTLGFLMMDEQDAQSATVLQALENGAQAIVPAHWPVEVANSMRCAFPKRINETELAELCETAADLPVDIDDEPRHRIFKQSVRLATAHNLSVYDAAYLELAMRENAKLATKDTALTKAARMLGVLLF